MENCELKAGQYHLIFYMSRNGCFF